MQRVDFDNICVVAVPKRKSQFNLYFSFEFETDQMECDSFDFATKKHEKQSEYGPDVLLYI